jgi:DNA transformation protein
MDPEHIREIFSAFGPVSVRRMFGGAGIYADGVMFALVADGVIYLKVDAQNEPDFEREKLAPFTYVAKNNKRAVMSYRRMPDRFYDEPEELAGWAREALAAARRAQKPRPGGRPARPAARR